jgi:hypothetical protein
LAALHFGDDEVMATRNITAKICAGALIASSAWASAQTPAPAADPPPSPPVPVIEPGKNTVAALSWMVGCWRSSGARDGSTSNEIWLAPRGGSMVGVGQSFRDVKALSSEAMRLYDEGATVKLWLRPDAKKELTLSLEAAGERFAAFSVTDGDTTTKLRYESNNATEMKAKFRLERGLSRRGADFSFIKVDCAEVFAPLNTESPAK